MSGANGSAKLTPEQQAWFAERFNIRYLHVQTNADTPNRRQRRAMKKAS